MNTTYINAEYIQLDAFMLVEYRVFVVADPFKNPRVALLFAFY